MAKLKKQPPLGGVGPLRPAVPVPMAKGQNRVLAERTRELILAERTRGLRRSNSVLAERTRELGRSNPQAVVHAG